MKNLLFTILFLSLCISCQKPIENDFALTREISIHSVTCPVEDTSKFIVLFNLESLTNDQIQAHTHRNTFSRWYVPNDTIWLLNEFIEGYPDKQRYFIVYPDSAFVVSTESAELNTCTYHVKYLKIHYPEPININNIKR